MVLAVGCAGCSSGMQSTGSLASASGALSSGATVAFESIDGPPPAVFRKLVEALNEEAHARQVRVVSRLGPARYRVRGYVSAVVEGGKTSFDWVWDVYDADKRRALRISGKAPAAKRQRDAWSAADDQVLRRMAGDGMERLTVFLNASERTPAFASTPDLLTLAWARDDSPEAAGIFRLWAGERPPAGVATTEPAAAEVPLPRRRPTVTRRHTPAVAPRTQAMALAPRR